MMPPWVRESPRNGPRAAAIGEVLRGERYDILCLEKAFDSGARAVIGDALGERYPYRYGPANDVPGVEINSGVWVLSRLPLTDYQEIEFADCRGIECFSRKGAVLLSGRCGTAPFRLVVTHLQGEEGPVFTEKNQRVRQAQMRQLRDQLLTPNLEPNVPFILCGDLGTPRFTEVGSESPPYREMLATFGAQNGSEARITLDEARDGNTLATAGSNRKNELDYILVRPNGCALTVQRERRIFKRAGWDDSPAQRPDLSYRYAVVGTVTFGG
jgi:endonuclease/exonuclease/phosphatase family metal-dependent hydrolase